MMTRMRRLVRSRFAPYLLAVVTAGISVLALLPEPPEGPRPQRTDYVIVIGAAGLRWDDIDATRTPNLWSLAEHGAIGALSVRSAGKTTCPADGWLTLGAGNRAQRTDGPVDGVCPPLSAQIERTSAAGATLADQRAVVEANSTLAGQVKPGALAEAVRCTTAIGQGAAIAAARPFGRIDRYQHSVGTRAGAGEGEGAGDGEGRGLTQELRACSLAIVDVGTVAGRGTGRYASASAADDAVEAVLRARPERSLVIVAGLSDTADVGRLHVAIAEGPGYGQGWLMSSTTGRPGYVQLVDLAPTALEVLDRPVPGELFVGAAVGRAGDRPARLAEAVHGLADADQQVTVQRVVAARFLMVLAIGQLFLFWGITPILRRARRTVIRSSNGHFLSAHGPYWHGSAVPVQARPLSRRVLGAAETLLVAAALAVPAALVADLVPWWRWQSPTLLFVVVTMGVLAVATAGIVMLGRNRRAMTPLGAVAAVAALAVAADVMTGSRLQLNGVAGYSAATSGRYAGLGIIGLGVLVAGLLLPAGALATHVPRRWRPCVVTAVGAVGVVVVGSPYLGADAAGAVALSAGVALAAAAASGGWLTLPRVSAAVVTAAAVTTGFAMLDLRRPESQRGNIGRFLVSLGDQNGSTLDEQRLGAHNITTMATSPMTLLVIGSALFIWFVLLRPNGGLQRLFGLYPAIRATLGGMCVATVFAGLVEGVGLNVLGAAAATAMPLVVLAVLRVLRHADDRTQPKGDPAREADDRTQPAEGARSERARCDTAEPLTSPQGEVLA